MTRITTFLVAAATAVSLHAYDTPEAVDLGLSVKFASGVISTGGSYNMFYFGEPTPPTVMNQPSALTGIKVGGDISGTIYDVATVNLGREWRMPTKAEMQELLDNAVFEAATVNGRQGWNVTGTSGNSIFIPSTGTSSSGAPVTGVWTSTTDYSPYSFPSEAAMQLRKSGGEEFKLARSEYGKYSVVLAVLNERTGVKVTSVTLNTTSISLLEGKTDRIFPCVSPADASDKWLKFTSSNPEVATVTELGEISALTPGEATITVETVDGSGISAQCVVTVTAKPAVEKRVDLGLSVAWAGYNVGAESPEEAGTYYGFAESEPKRTYNSMNYTHYDWGGYSFPSVVYGTEYDAATKEWGSDWITPTKEMVQELIDNCDVTREDVDGVVFYRFTSKINGNSILMRASSYMDGSSLAYNTSKLYIWTCDRDKSSSNFSPKAYALQVSASAAGASVTAQLTPNTVYYGMPVRPVAAPALEGFEVSCAKDGGEILLGQAFDVTLTPIPAVASPSAVEWSCNDVCDMTVNAAHNSVAVIGKTEGTATVTASYGGVEKTITVTVKGYQPTRGEVDMGYGRVWSDVNLGATSPEEIGHNYWWGLKEPQAVESEHMHDWPREDIAGNASYDPATDLGTGWTCGTVDHWEEMLENTTQQWVKYNGVYGIAYFSKHNDNSLFLPVADASKTSYSGGKWTVPATRCYMTGSYPGNESTRVHVVNLRATTNTNTDLVRMLNLCVRPSRDAKVTGIGSIEADGVADAFDVYTVMGVRVLSGVSSSALSSLPAGIYILRDASGNTVKIRL